MKVAEKKKARILRKKGCSINQIVKEVGCAKSSISLWVQDIVLTKEQRKGLSERGRSVKSIEKRRMSRIANEYKKRRKVIEEAKKDFQHISLKELKLIGIMLYLGEGGKTGNWSMCLANSDPVIIQIMMRFFKEICKVPDSKFRASIHTFAHADVEKTEKYWSQLTKIPRKQFYKTYTKPSIASLQKRKTLPFGTLEVYVHDTRLFLTMMGWIEKIKELTVGRNI